MRILLFGKDGMLGSSFNDSSIIKLGHKDCDVTNIFDVERTILLYQPQVVINCTGINDIYFCEQNKEFTYLLNVSAPVNLLNVCTRYKIKLIQFSTVFSGSSNIYTKSKMMMEEIFDNCGDYFLILRMPWLFSNKNDKKFLRTVLDCIKDNKPVGIYDNEIGSPTYTKDVADFSIKNHHLSGIYNIGNSGIATRRQWANKIAEFSGNNDCEFSIIHRTVDMITDSTLKNNKETILLRPWEEALKECLN